MKEITKCYSPGSRQFQTNTKFIMSCSAKTDVVLYDLNGAILSKLDTVLGKNYWAQISPDGKLLASSGFTPDVKVSTLVENVCELPGGVNSA